MIIAISTNDIIPYSLKSDTGGENGVTCFDLSPIDGVLLSAIEDSQTQFKVSGADENGSPDISINLHAKRVEMVRFGLKGWSNFKDATGQDVPFTLSKQPVGRVGVRPCVSPQSLMRLPKQVIDELAEKISEMSTVTKEQEKN